MHGACGHRIDARAHRNGAPEGAGYDADEAGKQDGGAMPDEIFGAGYNADEAGKQG